MPCNNGDVFDYLGSIKLNSIFLSSITKCDINSVVKSLGNKNSNDYSDLSMNVTKNVILNIADQLALTCNMSLYYGHFPQRMKIAKVVPIHMSGDEHIFAIYRPMSLLPQSSRISETIF